LPVLLQPELVQLQALQITSVLLFIFLFVAAGQQTRAKLETRDSETN
jgi:hypothetical protein